MARKIIAQFGAWSVTTTGIWHKQMDYQIDNERFNDDTWPDHIKNKTWGDYINFCQAWKFATERVKKLEAEKESKRKSKRKFLHQSVKRFIN